MGHIVYQKLKSVVCTQAVSLVCCMHFSCMRCAVHDMRVVAGAGTVWAGGTRGGDLPTAGGPHAPPWRDVQLQTGGLQVCPSLQCSLLVTASGMLRCC